MKNRKTLIISSIMIFVCVACIVFLCCRKGIFGDIDNKFLSVTVNVLSAAVVVFCIYLIYLQVFKIIKAVEKGKPEKTFEPVCFSIGETIELVKSCDVIEITAVYGSAQIRLGSTSDSTAASPLFNKEYYIEKEDNYRDIEDFNKRLCELFKDGKIRIVMIDGLNPEDYKK